MQANYQLEQTGAARPNLFAGFGGSYVTRHSRSGCSRGLLAAYASGASETEVLQAGRPPRLFCVAFGPARLHSPLGNPQK